MRKQIYLAIKERLQRLIIDKMGAIIIMSDQMLEEFKNMNITPNYAIKHIALWNRQVEFIEEENIFAMPAAFIEFGKIQWRHQGGGLGGQDADLTVGIHVISAATPEGLDHLSLLDDINRCLHKFSTEHISSMQRTQSIPCHDHEEVLDDVEVFQCVIYDRTAQKKTL